MVKMLEKKGLILRHPGQARAIEILVPEDEIPPWNARKPAPSSAHSGKPKGRSAIVRPVPAASLYVVSVFLVNGPVSQKFANTEISRVIEIRGDQTLEQLHQVIFQAFDRWEHHSYEFQLGKRPFDPDGPSYEDRGAQPRKKGVGNARTTTLDDLNLKPQRVFGYWFDFGDHWYHQIQVDRVEKAITTVTYPRVTKRVGKAPPQYCHK
jgi:hypothetical protein